MLEFVPWNKIEYGNVIITHSQQCLQQEHRFWFFTAAVVKHAKVPEIT